MSRADTSPSPEAGEREAWLLTAAISPRPSVRVATVDAYGTALNTYARTQAITTPAPPGAPWAVNLADETGQFRLLCFDLDATKGDPEADSTRLSALLEAHGIEHLVTVSGPSGGRHVWCALEHGADAQAVADLAHLVRAGCPSLDIAPLSNPATGCVRPPGAPHRHGGTSQVLSGSEHVLTHPTTTAAQLAALCAALSEQITAQHHAENPKGEVTVATDRAGRPYLPGVRGELPPASQAALSGAEAAAQDASRALWIVLIGAAAASWHLADLGPLVADAPGMEHVRTRRGPGSTRTSRPLGEQRRVLAHHWARAVRWAAENPRASEGADPTFAPRALAVTQRAMTCQYRADASPGRWATGTGPSDRRVLDALCYLSAQAVAADVEADIRRLALMCGIGRETARTSLLRLAEQGWITQTAPAEGRQAARWSLHETPHPPLSTPSDTENRSQALTRPPHTGPALRTRLLDQLGDRLAAGAHDAFAHRTGLGRQAGNLYASLSATDPVSITVLATATGHTRTQIEKLLHALAAHHLIVRRRRGWVRLALSRRDRAARVLGCHGLLADRSARYALEREQWDWWQAELTWMTATRRTAANRRPSPGQATLLDIAGHVPRPAYPRRADRRGDHTAARTHLASIRQAA